MNCISNMHEKYAILKTDLSIYFKCFSLAFLKTENYLTRSKLLVPDEVLFL